MESTEDDVWVSLEDSLLDWKEKEPGDDGFFCPTFCTALYALAFLLRERKQVTLDCGEGGSQLLLPKLAWEKVEKAVYTVHRFSCCAEAEFMNIKFL